MNETTAMVVHSETGVLSRIGTPQERQYLIGIMAEQIGIPAHETARPDVIALLGAAAQRTMQYGWIPGIHMHVQKFETENSRNRRKKNPDAKPVYSYTLVDGEKAWKDSGTRWRDRGVNWRYQRKPMTLEEVAEEARLQGCPDRISSNSFGMWCRILIVGQDDPTDDDNPMWSAGVFFGKVRVGNFWRADSLPSGVSARDVAIRRADKRAMMQSELTLLPVDDLGASARIRKLEDDLRHEATVRARLETPMPQRQLAQVEDDGDMLWATEDSARPVAVIVESPSARPETPENSGARPDSEDVDFYDEGDVTVAEPSQEFDPPVDEPVIDEAPAPAPEADARPASARPVNESTVPCPSCHAPPGKMHATQCTASSARPVAQVSARPEPTPENVGARPAEKVQEFSSPLHREIASVYISDYPLPKPVSEFIRKTRNADQDSAMPMSKVYLEAIYVLFGDVLWADAEEAPLLLMALMGYEITKNRRPGQLVHGHLVRPLRDREESTLSVLRVLLEVVRDIIEQQGDDDEPSE